MEMLSRKKTKLVYSSGEESGMDKEIRLSGTYQYYLRT